MQHCMLGGTCLPIWYLRILESDTPTRTRHSSWMVLNDRHSCAGPRDIIASNIAISQELLAHPVTQEPQGAAELGAFLFKATARLPVSAQPFRMHKVLDPAVGHALYQSGDCLICQTLTRALGWSGSFLGQSTWSRTMTVKWLKPVCC